MSKKLKVLDLFSGIGGFSLGLERSGMQTVAFCEMDIHCQKVLKKHWPDIPIYSDVKELDGNKFKDVDLICGGFPCQDISVAGLQKGLKGERSGLWKEYKRLIQEIKPRYAIIENVANLRSKGLVQIIQDLWEIGYASEWHIISARSIGAPHLRERIWIIAYPNTFRCSSKDKYREPKGQAYTGSSNKNDNNTRKESGNKIAYSDNFRFWKAFTSEKEKSEWWTKATSCFSNWKEIESIVCGVDDGIPRKLEQGRRQRIKQLGNSVLPQIPEIIGREIVEWERE